MDFPGLAQHFTIPARELSEIAFSQGIGFDGSSIRGWQAINESDMLVLPQSDTAFIDPFTQVPTLVMFCNIHDPITKESYTRDPRNVAQKAVHYMSSTGVADEVLIGAEIEFFVFDDIRFDQNHHQGYYFLDSGEGRWNMGRDEDPNLGYKIRYKEGYFPVPPSDTLMNLRTEMMLHLIDCGAEVVCQNHEVATGGQCGFDLKYGPLVGFADNVVLFKYIAKNVARKNGKVACFMPKPLFEDHGSGMHVKVSLRKDEQPIFHGNHYAGLSETAMFAMGGLLHHSPALMAFCAPTTNSYKRLVPGYEAPVNLTYSRRNRSAACRIPAHSPEPSNKRFEYRCPDSSSNPYLAFSAMLMAMIDGIQKRIDPGEPLDRDMYDLETEEGESVPQTPTSLEHALEALEQDQEFLLRGDVFTTDVIDTWIWYKQSNEVEAVRNRPHPYEFVLYSDI